MTKPHRSNAAKYRCETVGAQPIPLQEELEDNDNAPSVTIADASIIEGGNPGFVVTLTIHRLPNHRYLGIYFNGTATNGDKHLYPTMVTSHRATIATAIVPTTVDTIDVE
jgi:hypothetical protein